MKRALLCSIGLGLCLLAGRAASADAPSTMPAATQPSADAQTPVNTMCPVQTNNPIDKKITTVFEGQTIAFCCEDCRRKFDDNPAKYMDNLGK